MTSKRARRRRTFLHASPRRVALCCVLVGALLILPLAGCRGKPANIGRSVDDIARLVSGKVAAESSAEQLANKTIIEMRVRSILKPVERLSPEDRADAIEYACYAKDAYDLTDPAERQQAAADYHAYGAHAAAIAGLLREFAELDHKPSVSGAVSVTTGTICAVQ